MNEPEVALDKTEGKNLKAELKKEKIRKKTQVHLFTGVGNTIS